jgi:uncharacterized protein YbaA (DUF1428 family)
MSRYIDAFVLPITKDKVEEYAAIARKAAIIWKDHGALEYTECVLDDPEAKDMVPFSMCARAQEGETVVFAWIAYASKEERDKTNEAAMNDPRMKEIMAKNAEADDFDYTRMAYGGFRTIVDGAL